MKRGYNAAMKIDITPLEKALAQLEESLRILDSRPWGDDENLKRSFELGAIQAFGVTYSVAMNLLRRQMEQEAADPGRSRAMDIENRFRLAADAGLIPDAERFFDYRKKRELTAQSYLDEIVQELMAILDPFYHDACFLLEALRERGKWAL